MTIVLFLENNPQAYHDHCIIEGCNTLLSSNATNLIYQNHLEHCLSGDNFGSEAFSVN